MKVHNILILAILYSVSIYSQDISDIKGKWYCYKVVDEEGSTGENYTFSGEPYATNYRLNFVNEKMVLFALGETIKKGHYSLNEKTLHIEDKPYIIQKISKDVLIIKEKETSSKSLINVSFTYYYKRKL